MIFPTSRQISKTRPMKLDLSGKIVVVTGGARGLGKTEAEAFVDEGCKVVIVGRDLEKAKEVCSKWRRRGRRVIPLQGDVTKSQDVQRVMQEVVNTFGRLDILVNNAGITGPSLNKIIVELEEKIWDTMIDSHLKSTFLCIKYAAPHMITQGWGRIINTASIHGRVGGRPKLGHYGAAKAGITALTKTAARELGPKGITSNVIAPGFIRTAQLEKILSAESRKLIREQIPLGRMGDPEEIANVVVFLSSQAASYINGAVIDINGGRWEYYI